MSDLLNDVGVVLEARGVPSGAAVLLPKHGVVRFRGQDGVKVELTIARIEAEAAGLRGRPAPARAVDVPTTFRWDGPL